MSPYINGDELLPPVACTTRLAALQDDANANAAVAAAVSGLMMDYNTDAWMARLGS